MSYIPESETRPIPPNRWGALATPEVGRHRRRAAAGVLAVVAVAGVGAVSWVGNWLSDNDSASVLEARPAANEICLPLTDVRARTHILLDEADKYADGRDVGPISANIGKLSVVDRDAAICRPEDATELDANHVVPADAVPASQVASVEEFDAHGGYSTNIGN